MKQMHLTYIGLCQYCSKQCYTARKEAKAAAKRLEPGHHWSIYRCGEYWHYGHMPKDLIRGRRPKADFDKHYEKA